MRVLTVLATLTLVGTMAHAVIDEVEPNDTFLTAQTLNITPVDAEMVLGKLIPDDVDFFKIYLEAGWDIDAVVMPLADSLTPDTIVSLYDPAGNLRRQSDDIVGGRGSAFHFTNVDMSGDWRIAVTGYPDFGNDGGHSERGRYSLNISLVPEPASMIALGAGLVGLLARRRNRK